MIDTDPLLSRLRAADPVGEEMLPTVDVDAFVATTTLGTGRPRPVAAPVRGRRVLRRRMLIAAAAGAAGLIAIPLLSSSGGPAQDAGSRAWLPNAAAAELNTLGTAAGAAGHASDRLNTAALLHTRERNRVLNVQLGSVPGSAAMRWWQDSTTEQWRGSTCNDRQVTTMKPFRFFTDGDKAAYDTWAAGPGGASAREAAKGGQEAASGSQLWEAAPGGAPTNPCDRIGSLANPNPAYAATLPSTPSRLLDQLAHDGHTDNDATATGDALLDVLTWTWLTAPQRRAAIEAVGLLPADWAASPAGPVDGTPAVQVRTERDGIETTFVLTTTSPCIRTERIVLTEPDRANRVFDRAYTGVPAGTVLLDRAITVLDTIDGTDGPEGHARP